MRKDRFVDRQICGRKGVALVARPIEEDAQDKSVPMTQQRRAESGIQPVGKFYEFTSFPATLLFGLVSG